MNGKEHTRITDLIKHPFGINLFSAGVCNLKCPYCYIHKDKIVTPEIHKKILKNIEDGSYLETIKYWFDPNMVCAITHWGTEPTMTFTKFIPFYKEAFDQFKNLNEISFSTNLMLPRAPEDIIFFLETFSKQKFQLSIQLSLDGPPEFTNENRLNGGYETITENIYKLATLLKNNKKIQSGNAAINCSFKSTLSNSQFKKITKYNKYVWYMTDYNNVFNKIDKIIQNTNNIKFTYNASPTLIYPGDLKKSDGIALAMVGNNAIQYGNDILYYNDFCRFINSLRNNKLFKIPNIFQCSAGNGSFAINEDLDIVLCHRAFFTTNQDYLQAIKNDETTATIDKNNIITGRENIFNLIKITKNDNKENLINKLLLTQTYADTITFKIHAMTIMITQFAKNGIILPIYKKLNNARFLAQFLTTVRGCPAENVVKTGSMFLPLTPMIIAFGNGLFEILKEHYKKENKNDTTKK
jgi:sulfatase maturation enzyme AslB (radical SAM superfamily)